MRQVSATPHLRLWAFPLLAGLVLLPGCRKEDVQTYNVPKESAASVTPAQPGANPMAVGAQSGPSAVHWTTPPGWQEQPPGGMRAGSFIFEKDGQKADVSIIPLGGGSGGELANVNRWRGQVGLPPVEESSLSKMAEPVSIGNTPAPLYDMAGTDPQTQRPARILGSLLSADGTTWFFKMTGNDALVAQEKPAFKEFLKSIRFDATPGSSEVAQVAKLPAMTPKGLPPGLADGSSSSEKPTWTVPAGWQEQTASAMRVATFGVTGGAGAKADVSVIKLGGPAGGVLANVNRWRSQVGLEPVDDAGLQKLITTREIGGQKIIFVDMAGQSAESGNKSRLIAAIVPRSDVTWFYKMLGDDQLVEQQKDAFTKFVQSVHYPNAS